MEATKQNAQQPKPQAPVAKKLTMALAVMWVASRMLLSLF